MMSQLICRLCQFPSGEVATLKKHMRREHEVRFSNFRGFDTVPMFSPWQVVSYKLPLTLALSLLSAEEEEQLITRTNVRLKTFEDCKTLDIGDSIFKNKVADGSQEEVGGKGSGPFEIESNRNAC